MIIRLLKRGWGLEKTHSVERMRSLAEEYGVRINLNDDEIAFIDGIYRGRYPAEAGLIPYGEPTSEDAARAVSIAERALQEARTDLEP